MTPLAARDCQAKRVRVWRLVVARIQNSTVKAPPEPTLRLVWAGTRIASLVPSKEKAEETCPVEKSVPLSRRPLLPPTTSLALPLPGHHAASPGGSLIVQTVPTRTSTRSFRSMDESFTVSRSKYV